MNRGSPIVSRSDSLSSAWAGVTAIAHLWDSKGRDARYANAGTGNAAISDRMTATMSNDLINALFEIGGAFVLLLNLKQLRCDREVKGIDWRAVVFFTLWGFWNCYFYAAVGAPTSAVCAAAVSLVNLTWLSHLAYYSWHLRPLPTPEISLQQRPVESAQIPEFSA